jgi:hypothetical protein
VEFRWTSMTTRLFLSHLCSGLSLQVVSESEHVPLSLYLTKSEAPIISYRIRLKKPSRNTTWQKNCPVVSSHALSAFLPRYYFATGCRRVCPVYVGDEALHIVVNSGQSNHHRSAVLFKIVTVTLLFFLRYFCTPSSGRVPSRPVGPYLVQATGHGRQLLPTSVYSRKMCN